jgi:hypothetical protein
MSANSDSIDDEILDNEDHQKHIEVIEKGFRRQFEAGDELALLDCIRWCDSYHLTIPAWVRSVLSTASNKYLSGVSSNFHDALFGAKKKDGRHSNPRTARQETRQHQLAYDLVIALRQHGLKGDQLYKRTREFLQILYIDVDNRLRFRKQKSSESLQIKTIKKRVERMKRDGARPSGFAYLMPMIVDLGDPPRRK